MNHLPLRPNRQVRKVWWPVRKLGTTYVSGRLHKAGYLERMTEITDAMALTDYEHFAVVRPPTDRYVSALAQMWRNGRVGDVDWQAWIEGVNRYNLRSPEPWTAGRDPHFEPCAPFYAQAPNMRLWQLNDVDDMLAWAGCPVSLNGPPQNVSDPTMLAAAHLILDPEPIKVFYADDIKLTEQHRKAM